MSTQSNALPNSSPGSQGIAPVPVAETRPMYWSVRRELWENRSIYIAPLGAAVAYLVGYSISLLWLPRSMRRWAALDPTQHRIKLAEPYAHAGMLVMFIAFL